MFLICPNCNSNLTEVRRDDVMIDICKSCKGVWLDSGELERLLSSSYYTDKRNSKKEFAKKHPFLYVIKEILD